MMHLASCPHLNRKTHIPCTFVQICDLRICVNWLFRWPTICSAFSPCHIPKCMHHVPILFSAVFQSIIRLYYVYRHMCMGMSAHTALYRSTHTHRYAFPKKSFWQIGKISFDAFWSTWTLVFCVSRCDVGSNFIFAKFVFVVCMCILAG